MEQQVSLPGNDLTPTTFHSRHTLSTTRDIPLLQLIRDCTVITRPQIEELLPASYPREMRQSLNRRIKRLHALGQIKEHRQVFPYSGRVFSITSSGLSTLELSGLGILSVTSETEVLDDPRQAVHFLALNTVQTYMRKFFSVGMWWGDRYLKSLNIAANRPTQKDYDAVAELNVNADGSPIRVGIEYERTLKSRERYVAIRKALSSESQIRCLLYFADTEAVAQVVSSEVYAKNLLVGTIMPSEFYSDGSNCRVRVVQQDGKVVQAPLIHCLQSV